MPDFPGQLAAGMLSYQLPIPIVKYTEPYFDHDNSDFSAGAFPITIPGAHVRSSAQILGQNKPGAVAHSFSADFYNRIHISPNPLDFGSLLEETTLTVEIWNAFFSSTTWNGFTTERFDGLQLDPNQVPPPPIILGPLVNHNIDVIGFTAGPAAITAEVIFDMPGRTVQNLEIVGRRAKLFPFFTSWEKNPIETLTWRTDIVKTEREQEFRYRVRQYPRRSFRFGVGAVNIGAADMRVALLSSQGSEFGLPLWMYETELTQEANIGDLTIHVKDTDHSDFEVDHPALIYLTSEQFETVLVKGVAPGVLTLDADRNVQQFWPVGMTKVYPVRLSRFSPRLEVNTLNPTVALSTLNFSTLEAETRFSTISLPQYKGYWVLNWMPNWAKRRSQAYTRNFQVIDDGISQPEYHDVSFRFGEEQDFEFYLKGRAAVAEFKAIMQYMGGRHAPIWVPSWQDDLPLAEDYTAGSFHPIIRSNFASKFKRANIAETTHVRLRTIDGTEYYDRLDGASAAVTNSSYDELTLSLGWGSDILVREVDNFCLMSLMRLASDEVEIEWYTSQMARAKVTFAFTPEQPL